jgi:phage-related protein
MREVRFYRLPSGRPPVERFLEGLPARLAQKVTWVLGLVEDLDLVPRQYFKKLEGTGGLWEIRAGVGRETVRLLGFFDGPRLVILTHGFLKKSQRIPLGEIEIAERRKADHLRRQR